jgi:hypothetical protein
MAIEFNEEKQVYSVDGVEVPKAAYDAIHSVGAAGTNRRVKQMLATIYPDQDPKEIEKMTLKDIAEFIATDRNELKTVKPEVKPAGTKEGKEPEIDVKLELAKRQQELENEFKQKELSLKKRTAIDDLRQQAISLGLREDLRDPEVFAAFAKRKWALDETSLSGDKARWVDVSKDQIVIGPDGKEAGPDALAKILFQTEPNSFQVRKHTPAAGKINPGMNGQALKDMPTDQLLAMAE